MTIRFKPEVEALKQRDVERGPYQSSDDFVEEAVRQLHDQEEWLSENRARITPTSKMVIVLPNGVNCSRQKRFASV